MRPQIEWLEKERPADLGRDSCLLAGVWQLRWSSSALPYRTVAPWLENLQVLDPERCRGMKFLRLVGVPAGATLLAGSSMLLESLDVLLFLTGATGPCPFCHHD